MPSSAQSRRRSRRLLALVLPLVLLRLLVPAGFMPMAGERGVAIGLCPGDAAMVQAAAGALAAHHLHHAEPHGASGEPAVEHHAPCLFAASAVPAFAPAALPPGLAPVAAARVTVPARARGFTIASIQRAQSPRAPPLRA